MGDSPRLIRELDDESFPSANTQKFATTLPNSRGFSGDVRRPAIRFMGRRNDRTQSQATAKERRAITPAISGRAAALGWLSSRRHRKNIALYSPQDRIGDAAEKDAFNASQSACADDEQVGLFLLDEFLDGSKCRPLSKAKVVSQIAELELVDKVGEFPPRFGSLVRDVLFDFLALNVCVDHHALGQRFEGMNERNIGAIKTG